MKIDIKEILQHITSAMLVLMLTIGVVQIAMSAISERGTIRGIVVVIVSSVILKFLFLTDEQTK